MSTSLPSAKPIDSRITRVGVRPVLLSSDLADLLGVPLDALRRIVDANQDHFPGELCFTPELADFSTYVRNPRCEVFTEPGAWMVAALLGTSSARMLMIEISRAFERYRRK